MFLVKVLVSVEALASLSEWAMATASVSVLDSVWASGFAWESVLVWAME